MGLRPGSSGVELEEVLDSNPSGDKKRKEKIAYLSKKHKEMRSMCFVGDEGRGLGC